MGRSVDVYRIKSTDTPFVGSRVSENYITKWRKNLVNPGNRKSPTRYSKLFYDAGFGNRTINNRYYNESTGKWIVDPPSVNTYDRDFALTSSSTIAWSLASHPDGSNADRVAKAKLFGRISKLQNRSFNAATFFAEADKSLKTVLSTANRLSRALRSVRRGNLLEMYRELGVPSAYAGDSVALRAYLGKPVKVPKGVDKDEYLRWLKRPKRSALAKPKPLPPAKDVRDNASNYWLEAKYGWGPIFMDAEASAEKAAHEIVTRKVELFRIVGSFKETDPFSSTPITDGLQSGHHFRSSECRCQYGVYYRISNEWIALASSMGLTNPMALAWEVIPLSFVLDWFIPIGAYLERLSAFHGLEFLSGWRTQGGLIKWGFSIAGATLYGSGTWLPGGVWGPRSVMEISSSSGFYHVGGMYRSVLTTFPDPDPPEVKVRFKWIHVVTGLALARQMSK